VLVCVRVCGKKENYLLGSEACACLSVVCVCVCVYVYMKAHMHVVFFANQDNARACMRVVI
jgi:hypothetical protein